MFETVVTRPVRKTRYIRGLLLLRALLAHALLLATPGLGEAISLPAPGSPARLIDWRWIARPSEGQQTITSDPWGQQKLPPVDGGFLVAESAGPGVLEHLWTTQGNAVLAIETDGAKLWNGSLRAVVTSQPPGQGENLFRVPLIFDGGGMYHLVAPIGFRQSLRIVSDTAVFPRYVAIRTYPPGSEVMPASLDPAGGYATGLRAAAEAWKNSAPGFLPADSMSAKREVVHEFTARPGDTAVALECSGSGEVVRLEFHVCPPLPGSLRHVVAEFYYDGATAPSLRIPLPDVAGVPHPWALGRWHTYNGDLAAGLRYPWQVHTPRVTYPEITVILNLPLPFGSGLRVRLVNRSDSICFNGFTRASVIPLDKAEARRSGRLCGARSVTPVVYAAEAAPVIRVPGPGQLVGLGLYLTGNESHYPPAVRTSVIGLAVDRKSPILGHGLLPLWFQGIYGGPVSGAPFWNHPLYEHRYAGVTRHFITDPIPFAQELEFRFTPGLDKTNAPDQATALAFWYHFGEKPYEAAQLPGKAESLPYSILQPVAGPEGSRLFRYWEAERLAVAAGATGAEVRAVTDEDHNYHPSDGRYLLIAAGRIGAFADCPMPLPPDRYFVVGTNALWGPSRADFEIEALSPNEAMSPPGYLQGDKFYSGRLLGSTPMKAPVFGGHWIIHHRDVYPEFTPPLLNPARDRAGVLRFICQSLGQGPDPCVLRLDQIRIDVPQPAPAGWFEFEDGWLPEAGKGLRATLPKYGNRSWSAWGSVVLSSPAGGTAQALLFVPHAGPKPAAVLLRGCLAPDKGGWQAHVAGMEQPVPLAPGKDANGVVTWRLPMPEISLPGAFELGITCTGQGSGDKDTKPVPPAELVLDAWKIE